ncbi:MAG: transglycosylase SLT domain-containing protein [Acidobacteria bacterium]|nr:transglycosylase SLT domain-containing protein [Acidobacteriota bacterium]
MLPLKILTLCTTLSLALGLAFVGIRRDAPAPAAPEAASPMLLSNSTESPADPAAPLPDPAQGDDSLAVARRLDAQGRNAAGELAQLNPQEHLRRAAVYHANRAFAEARAHWTTLIGRYPRDPAVPAALFGIGRTFYQERRYADALPFFERLGRDHIGQKEGREGFYYVAATVLRLGRPADAAARYGEYAVRFPQGERVESAYTNAIDSWREAGRKAEAVDWIARTRERFRDKTADTNALFARLRLDVATEDWASAVGAADELRRKSLPSGISLTGVQTTGSEVAYLRAYSLERAKQKAQAEAAYGSIPDRAGSYFGWLATERLDKLGGAAKRAAAARNASVGAEVKSAANLYPAPHREVLLRAAKGKNVDPRFVLAIMRQESGFRANARSQAGARGLLQLTIDIANKYGARAGLRGVREDDLYRPEVNIPIAAAYLDDLFRMFPDLPEAVAAAYNGGEDNVERWVRRAVHKDPGVFTAEIGFAESKDYALKVMANYRAYQQLYTSDLGACTAAPARPVSSRRRALVAPPDAQCFAFFRLFPFSYLEPRIAEHEDNTAQKPSRYEHDFERADPHCATHHLCPLINLCGGHVQRHRRGGVDRWLVFSRDPEAGKETD